MKAIIPGIMAAALLASPVLAQNTNTGNASAPGVSVSKDDLTYRKTTRSKKHATNHMKRKHTASYNKKQHAKAMSSKAQQTTGSGSSSAPGAGVNKDDTTPKSR
jgi:hypothetical protein